MDKFNALRAEMSALQNVIYLNWGGSGPSPKRVIEAECRAIHALNDEHGPMSVIALQAAAEMLAGARRELAQLLGCDDTEIALMESTSAGINRIAWGIDWQPGDEVIITDTEHISGIAPWTYLQEQRGIRLVEVATRDGQVDADTILAQITPRTRLVFISHVSYVTGSVLPVADLAAAADVKGFWLGIDGAQAVGAFPVDLNQLGVHFYALPGQKWLLGPDGTGAFYVRRDMLDALRPSHIGWASLHEEALHGGACRFHSSARRFEVAGHRVPAFAALAEAIHTVREIGIDSIQARIGALTGYLHNKLVGIPGVSVRGRQAYGNRAVSGLVSVALAEADPNEVVDTLWKEHDVVVRWIAEPRLLRFSLHAFNTEDEVDRAVDALRMVLEKVK